MYIENFYGAMTEQHQGGPKWMGIRFWYSIPFSPLPCTFIK